MLKVISFNIHCLLDNEACCSNTVSAIPKVKKLVLLNLKVYTCKYLNLLKFKFIKKYVINNSNHLHSYYLQQHLMY